MREQQSLDNQLCSRCRAQGARTARSNGRREPAVCLIGFRKGRAGAPGRDKKGVAMKKLTRGQESHPGKAARRPRRLPGRIDRVHHGPGGHQFRVLHAGQGIPAPVHAGARQGACPLLQRVCAGQLFHAVLLRRGGPLQRPAGQGAGDTHQPDRAHPDATTGTTTRAQRLSYSSGNAWKEVVSEKNSRKPFYFISAEGKVTYQRGNKEYTVSHTSCGGLRLRRLLQVPVLHQQRDLAGERRRATSTGRM
jgi:hypothetical protein